MKLKYLYLLLIVLTLASCGEYNKILKSRDPELKYSYAKKYFDEGQYGKTITLLEEIQTAYSATSKEQEVMFLLAQAYFYNKEYDIANARYTVYFKKFPKGDYAESARFNAAYSMYLVDPDVRLDQTATVRALEEFQNFIEYYPDSPRAKEAQQYMLKMQEKLAEKELKAAQLYYNLGYFMGNNYEACVVTAKDALKRYNFAPYDEEFQILIIRSKFEEAEMSTDYRKPIRYRSVIDEHFNYANMFPEGKYIKESTKYYKKANDVLAKMEDSIIKKEEKELEKAIK